MVEQADDRVSTLRRTYGRGFVEGLKAAGVTNVGDVMNQAKLRSIEQSLNGQARKVYEAVPIESLVDINDVIRLMAEKGCGRPEMRVVQGCLEDMVDRGLVRSPQKGRYQRVVARPVMVATVEPTESVNATEPVSISPLQQLAQIEQRITWISEKFAEELKSIQESVAAAAINVEDYLKGVKKDNEKLDALKNLLREL